MKEALLLFPHQLFYREKLCRESQHIVLAEDELFFSQFRFHKKKLVLHRASMKAYAHHVQDQWGNIVHYLEHADIPKTEKIFVWLQKNNIEKIHIFDTVDDYLERRIKKFSKKYEIELVRHDSPMFLNTRNDIADYFDPEKTSFLMAHFYEHERKKRKILVNKNGSPEGGKWSFDAENRKKLPKGIKIPDMWQPKETMYVEEAKEYVEKNFPKHYGKVDGFTYPVTRNDALTWFRYFLQDRFEKFGPYEDALTVQHRTLFHGVLTPMLNIGLLTPDEVIKKTLAHVKKNKTPIASVEGFIRQVMGWREFMRGMYVVKGRVERTKNHLHNTRDLPHAFWIADTGIDPVDHVIEGVMETGYAHHIERLMVLGNIMLLLEIHPDDVYRWFMELFIDAYDWVMVPNVYGMSQFADGGLFATKPYISSSNYIRKMSDFKKGEWCDIWDALYWRFIHKHRVDFAKNPRMSLMVKQLEKMDKAKRSAHLKRASAYLRQLS